MEKKIRVTLPRKIVEILENDIEEFFIKKKYFIKLYICRKNKGKSAEKICLPL